MKLRFTKEQIEKIIKAYYKINAGIDVEVNPVVSAGCEVRYETPCVNVKMMITRKMQILGETVTAEIELDKAEVTDILKVVLAKEEFEVESISYIAGIDNGDRFQDSYFNGMYVEGQSIKRKQKTI